MQNDKLLLLGDEAIAQAALDAGISGAYAYPGTPSTEIMEYIQDNPAAEAAGVHRIWSTNEKTAMEEGLGMSYAGKRAIVCMKHVGLNVAADPFVNSAITGANGGLLVIVADDPSMHSSQNEQDSRAYGRFAGIPVYEPSSQQEAYDMIFEAFELSERLREPVLFRITTRLAHSRADIVRRDPLPQKEISLPEDARQFVLLPVNARRNYAALLEKQADMKEASDQSPWNSYTEGADKSMGIIAAGIAWNYVMEFYGDEPCPFPVLKVCQYPLPPAPLRRMSEGCERILVLEEGTPFIEEMLDGPLGSDAISGRLDGCLPRTGELNPDSVAKALGREVETRTASADVLKPRPPQLCKACPHIDSYEFIKVILDESPSARVFSDIGCYTLGALPPYNAIHTCVDMGAAITMAKGAADAGIHPALSVIGDSTFTHSGITGLLDAVHEGAKITILILDNSITAMTGMQESMATGRLEQIVQGVGVAPEHVREVIPNKKNHEANVNVLREEIAFEGVSVIISRRSCIHVKRKI